MQFKRILFVLMTALVLLGSAQTSQAVLNAVDPGPYIADYGFFPVWYQDTFGLALELCLSPAEIAPGARPGLLGGAACTLLANPGIFDPAFDICFPGECAGVTLPPDQTFNFPDESFWFMGDASIVDAAAGIDLIYVSALEAAFGGGDPAPNDQVSFARIRIRVDVPVAGIYTVTHPYGVEVFDVTTPGRRAINMTRDIGIGAPGDFTGALGGDIGPFLMDASVPTDGLIPGTNPVTGAAELFVGDPNTLRPVVGSPFGTNFVRIQGPGIDVQTNLFAVMGKFFEGAKIDTPLVIERTTYSRTTGPIAGTVVAQQDVFVMAPPTATVSFRDANGANTTMTDADANGAWFGQSANDPTLPATIEVTANNSPVNNNSTASSDLADLVTITRAEYSGGTLVVEAASSDEVTVPTLTVLGVSMTPTGVGVIQSATIPGLTIPPARITVTSGNGGSDTEEVEVLSIP